MEMGFNERVKPSLQVQVHKGVEGPALFQEGIPHLFKGCEYSSGGPLDGDMASFFRRK